MKWLDKLLHPDEQTEIDCVAKYNGLITVIKGTQAISLSERMELTRLSIKIERYKLEKNNVISR